MTAKLFEYFNLQPRLGVMSTSSKDGKVDSAVYGSPQMIDKNTVVVALAKGRTFSNLQENPNAVFMIMEPGSGILYWKGPVASRPLPAARPPQRASRFVRPLPRAPGAFGGAASGAAPASPSR